MLARSLINQVLDNEALTRNLADPEARILVEWLVDQAERLARKPPKKPDAKELMTHLCRRARAIGRFVGLWCHQNAPGPAYQLAAVERFAWPLPTEPLDACELMEAILDWEARQPLD